MLEGGMVMVHLDARLPGVSVPPEFVAEPHLRLNLSYRFRPCDLLLGEEGVQVTLTFSGVPWACHLPYESIFGMTCHASGESLVWLEDVPEEVLDFLVGPELATAPFEPGPLEPELSHAVGAHAVRRGHLRLVK